MFITQELVDTIRRDIREFKETSGVDKVIVLWTANTERYSEVVPHINGTMDKLLNSIKKDEREISPSTLFAVASILEGVSTVTALHLCIVQLYSSDVNLTTHISSSFTSKYFLVISGDIHQWLPTKHFCPWMC